MKDNNNVKVFVGLSGGVDSSVSAALLKEAGYDVTGVFIKVWRPEFMECDNVRDRSDSMRAASELRIKWCELDLAGEYKRFVVDYMINEYSLGRVPNPDVMCNRFVKFGKFYDWAIKNDADFVATGHYARVIGSRDKGNRSGNLRTQTLDPKPYTLLVANDELKDQTYFLWNIPRNTLERMLFPIGGYTKSDVRILAKKFGLSAAAKKDSQGLCFVGRVDLRDFLSHFVKMEKGNVLNVEGKVIGRHDGAIMFTEGQRHGFTITKKTPNDMPYYVITKDMIKNTVTVAHSQDLNKQIKSNVTAEKVNWLGELPVSGTYCEARIRHGGKKYPATIVFADESSFTINCKKGAGFAPKGQSVVLYNGELVLGGGVIV